MNEAFRSPSWVIAFQINNAPQAFISHENVNDLASIFQVRQSRSFEPDLPGPIDHEPIALKDTTDAEPSQSYMCSQFKHVL